MMDRQWGFSSWGISAQFVGEEGNYEMFCCLPVLISLENTVSNPVFYNIQSSKIYKERKVALVICSQLIV